MTPMFVSVAGLSREMTLLIGGLTTAGLGFAALAGVIHPVFAIISALATAIAWLTGKEEREIKTTGALVDMIEGMLGSREEALALAPEVAMAAEGIIDTYEREEDRTDALRERLLELGFSEEEAATIGAYLATQTEKLGGEYASLRDEVEVALDTLVEHSGLAKEKVMEAFEYMGIEAHELADMLDILLASPAGVPGSFDELIVSIKAAEETFRLGFADPVKLHSLTVNAALFRLGERAWEIYDGMEDLKAQTIVDYFKDWKLSVDELVSALKEIPPALLAIAAAQKAITTEGKKARYYAPYISLIARPTPAEIARIREEFPRELIYPALQRGGLVLRPGLAWLHRGERVLPARAPAAITLETNVLVEGGVGRENAEVLARRISEIMLEEMRRGGLLG